MNVFVYSSQETILITLCFHNRVTWSRYRIMQITSCFSFKYSRRVVSTSHTKALFKFICNACLWSVWDHVHNISTATLLHVTLRCIPYLSNKHKQTPCHANVPVSSFITIVKQHVRAVPLKTPQSLGEKPKHAAVMPDSLRPPRSVLLCWISTSAWWHHSLLFMLGCRQEFCLREIPKSFVWEKSQSCQVNARGTSKRGRTLSVEHTRRGNKGRKITRTECENNCFYGDVWTEALLPGVIWSRCLMVNPLKPYRPNTTSMCCPWP